MERSDGMTNYLRLLAYLRPYWKRLAIAVVCSAFVSGFTGMYAYLARPVLDDIFINKDMQMLIIVPLALLAISLFKGGFTYAQAYLMNYVGLRVVADVRDQLYEHLMRLPLAFHIKNASGRLLARVLDDVHLFQEAVSGMFKDAVQQSLTVLVLVGVVFYQNWKLALLAVVVLPLSIYPMLRLGKRLRGIAVTGQERIADLAALIKESLTGIRVVKAFVREDFEAARFHDVNKKYFRATMKGAQVAAFTSPVMEFVGSIGVAAVVWYGGYLVIQDVMTPGAFASFLTAVFLLYNPIRRLAHANNTIQRALAAAQRIFSVLDEQPEHVLDHGRRVLPTIRGDIELRGVTFYYADTETPALAGIDMTAGVGEVVALVGHSGSGKTTFVNLIARFYDPTEGSILCDGCDIRDVSLSSLRQQIGMVSQDVLLFEGTIRSNIAYGRDDLGMDEVVAAAEGAYAHNFIARLPEGYDSIIGENGVKLSGGERQRIAIARAMLRNPRVLILDEATAALDTESEQMVQLALANLMKGRTTFVVAHRLSTIRQADRIVVLNQGKIVEIGGHEALLCQDGVYTQLHRIQG
ncbi:MAG TPA: lipid A export permease/ATP-binding protein MsbA [Nitrospirales bacterium]|nr:lipid A export permease/ATP-binding protein MsbA [Nitrospirales bacterium]